VAEEGIECANAQAAITRARMLAPTRAAGWCRRRSARESAPHRLPTPTIRSPSKEDGGTTGTTDDIIRSAPIDDCTETSPALPQQITLGLTWPITPADQRAEPSAPAQGGASGGQSWQNCPNCPRGNISPGPRSVRGTAPDEASRSSSGIVRSPRFFRRLRTSRLPLRVHRRSPDVDGLGLTGAVVSLYDERERIAALSS